MLHLSDAPFYRFASNEGQSGPDRRDMPEHLVDVPLDTHILVVEDDAMIAWMVESLLCDMGFASIAVVANGEDAITSAQERPPGLIVSDVNLGPGIDGIAAASSIVSAVSTPVVFITGYNIADVRARVEKAIPSASLLRKPVQIFDLETAIRRAISVLPPPH